MGLVVFGLIKIDSIIVFKCKPGNKNLTPISKYSSLCNTTVGKKSTFDCDCIVQCFLKIYSQTHKFAGKDMFYQLKIM